MCIWPDTIYSYGQCSKSDLITISCQNHFIESLLSKYNYIYIQRKIFFRKSIFLYSACPNLEGIKDALSYKFRRLMIGQNCCAVCTNKVARA